MSDDIEKSLEVLLQKISIFPTVLRKLDAARIRYGLYAGAHVATLANNRIPTDIDLLVHDDDLQRLKSLFPFAKTKDNGNAVFLYIGEGDLIECMGAADVIQNGNRYPFRLTDLAVSRLTTYNINGVKINLVDPVDTVLLKAILKRTPEQGKHDLEDIAAILAKVEIDVAYLVERLHESKAAMFTKDVWEKFQVPV